MRSKLIRKCVNVYLRSVFDQVRYHTIYVYCVEKHEDPYSWRGCVKGGFRVVLVFFGNCTLYTQSCTCFGYMENTQRFLNFDYVLRSVGGRYKKNKRYHKAREYHVGSLIMEVEPKLNRNERSPRDLFSIIMHSLLELYFFMNRMSFEILIVKLYLGKILNCDITNLRNKCILWTALKIAQQLFVASWTIYQRTGNIWTILTLFMHYIFILLQFVI